MPARAASLLRNCGRHVDGEKEPKMRVLRCAAMAAIACLMLAPAALALTVTHGDGGLSIDIPDGWTVAEETEEGVLSVNSPDEAISLAIWAEEDADTLDAALDGIGETLGEDFNEIEFDEEVQELEINGLPVVVLQGVGTDDEGDLRVAVAVVMADQPVIFFGYGDPETVAAEQEALHAMFSSIRPADAEE